MDLPSTRRFVTAGAARLAVAGACAGLAEGLAILIRAPQAGASFGTIALLVLLGPSLVGMGAFYILPVVSSFVLSFSKWDLLTPIQWIGIGNYTTALADPTVQQALRKHDGNEHVETHDVAAWQRFATTLFYRTGGDDGRAAYDALASRSCE